MVAGAVELAVSADRAGAAATAAGEDIGSATCRADRRLPEARVQAARRSATRSIDRRSCPRNKPDIRVMAVRTS
jgi:hypothetical protein